MFKHVSNIASKLKQEDKKAYAFATIVFLLHFWIFWNYTSKEIVQDAIWVIVIPLSILLEEGFLQGISNEDFQINSYTGNPFFLLPFIHLLDFSPLVLRILLGLSASAATAIFFLSYYELFDLKNAVIGILILFNFDRWLILEHPDYLYGMLFLAILFYFYSRWVKLGTDKGRNYLYVLSFLGGLFFYFKATVGYLLLSITIATLYEKGFSIIKKINLVAVIVLFGLGLSVFILHMSYCEGEMTHSAAGLAGQDGGVVDTTYERLHHLNVYTSTSQSLMSGLYVPYDLPEEITSHHSFGGLQGIYLSTILLGVAFLYLVLTGHRPHLVLIVFFMFILHFVIPSTSGLRIKQIGVIAPFFPIVFMSALERFSLKSPKIASKLSFLLILVLYLSLMTTLLVIERHESPQINLEEWGGEQEFYEEFKELEIEGTTVTNSYMAYTTTKYVLDIPRSRYLTPSDPNLGDYGPGDGGQPGAVRGTDVAYNEFEENQSVNVVLREDLPCTPYEEFCGAEAKEIKQEFGIEEKKEVSIQGISYWVIEDAVIQ